LEEEQVFNLKVFFFAAMIAVLEGCATTQGSAFNKQRAVSFVPGQSTKAQVVAALGKPFHEQTYTWKKDMADKELPNPAIVNELRFFHADRQASSKPAEVEASRNAFYAFNAGTLMSYWVIRTFPEDGTDFDENLAEKIVKKKTTEQEVIALLGQPAGRGIYPAAQHADGSSMIYEVFLYRPKTNQRTYKTMRVFLDKNRVVSDYELTIRSR
jgi:hypothetical protein